MLTLPLHPHDMPPILPLHVRPHPYLPFCTPTPYHAYAPTGPLRYASNAGTSSLHSPIPMLCELLLVWDEIRKYLEGEII
ncbi:hypothetical protein O181_013890, partial [Austropuccinia psidii MF-1]|nr:hypothetical protein [Austropuccinia psidii MF-1]